LPDDVIEVLRLASAEVVAEIADADPLAKRIYDSYMTFLQDVRRYHSISEQAYLNVRQEPSPEQAE
jgi:TRAP-type mannitol/chloroaromatic compound transport system substrate-binding protein